MSEMKLLKSLVSGEASLLDFYMTFLSPCLHTDFPLSVSVS